MSLTRAYLTSNQIAGTLSASVSCATANGHGFDSTGYTHLVVFVKWESGPTSITMSDNKGTSWSSLTAVDHTNGDMSSQMFWGTIGTPGILHDAVATFGANRNYAGMIVWGITASGGVVELDAQAVNQAVSGTLVDAGTLSTTGVPVVSIMGGAAYSTATYDPTGSGWTEDVDSIGGVLSAFGQSRASETTSPIDPYTTANTAVSWVANAASFREPGAALPNIKVATPKTFLSMNRAGGMR